jgi:hypothetical protein
MQVKTRIKASGTERNHNETLVRVQKPTQGLKVQTGLKAGMYIISTVQQSSGGK